MSSVVAVTGATGNVGGALVDALLKDDGVAKVVCLVRGEFRARELLPCSEKLEFVECDLAAVRSDPASFLALVDALAQCNVVYHSAGLPEQWQADERIFHRVNVEGTVSLMEALAESKQKDPSAPALRRFLLVSTMDVFHCEPNGTLVETNEATERDFGRPGKATAYEQSKVRGRGFGVVSFAPLSSRSIPHTALRLFCTCTVHLVCVRLVHTE